MYIRDVDRNINMALLAEGGNARYAVYKHGPPDGGRDPRCARSIDMALLMEGGNARCAVYKHRPPDGGRGTDARGL
jgi:hypothetical protein